MIRPRAATVGVGANPDFRFPSSHDGFSCLNSRDRAVNNEYCDQPPAIRPASASFSNPHESSSTHQEFPSKKRSNDIRLPVRCHSTDPNIPPRVDRELKPRSVPGIVRRAMTEEFGSTLNHVPLKFERLSGNSSQQNKNLSFSTPLLTARGTERSCPPPLPAKNQTSRTDSCVECRIVQNSNSNPIKTQPQSLKHEVKDCKKSIVVEIEYKDAVKTRRDSTTKSSRKLSRGEVRRLSGDSDHALIEVNEAKLRPGEHDYPCPRCGKCMCAQCKHETRVSVTRDQLMCGDRCLCNVDTIVESATCLCCIKACFYHCSNPDKDDNCSGKPCSCQDSNRCARWSAIIAVVPLLPCLLCYPVARGCIAACRACNRCSKPGCRCKESNR